MCRYGMLMILGLIPGAVQSQLRSWGYSVTVECAFGSGTAGVRVSRAAWA
ncbi:hypothetical protein [Deinococcus hopiensis]|uniref:Uncharacterized protein n=1 Tax=Deinococcus hopiensis KR-140 TaxID=695939 RepID=A0A1W1UDV9_9DEIO|nr:hypothetical protein [Deinococcus hopiensis]SMB79229.1 hypothetical protein SAMN00790413_05843 [Deinococcus hopiensis KR-140]